MPSSRLHQWWRSTTSSQSQHPTTEASSNTSTDPASQSLISQLSSTFQSTRSGSDSGIQATNTPSEPTATRDTTKLTAGPNYDISLLYDGKTQAVVDIVFVHGLIGNAFNTWFHKERGMHWPSDCLPQDIPDSRILSFGYDADVVNFWNPASTSKLSHHAEKMIGCLEQYRAKTNTESRPILFVVHSLGGLVTEYALSYSRTSSHPHLQTIERYTYGIAFLGTPHYGSELASWADFGTAIAQVVKRPNRDIIKVLKPGSEMLRVTENNFYNVLSLRNQEGNKIEITCFYEELPEDLVGQIVSSSSAEMRGYPFYGIHANHTNMTKFPDRDDKGYEMVLGQLQRWKKSMPKHARGMITVGSASGHNITTPKSVIDNLPSRLTLHFTGRNDILRRLDELSDPTRADNSYPIIISLVGMGGVGKTQIALKHCLNAKSSNKFDGVFWANASNEATLISSYRAIESRILRRQTLQDDDTTLDTELASSFTERLKDMVFLLVLDNYDDPKSFENIRKYIPSSGNGVVIVTSRHRGLSNLGQKMVVDCMNEKDACTLLRKVSERTTDSQDDEKALCHALGNLPLAIHQAASYILKLKLSFKAFLELFRQRKDVFKNLPAVWDYCTGETKSERNTKLGVYTTFALSLELLVKDDNDALKCCKISLISFASFLGTSQVSYQFLAPSFALDEEDAVLPTGAKFMEAIEGGATIDPEIRDALIAYKDHCQWMLPLSDSSQLKEDLYSEVVADFMELSLIEDMWRDDRGLCFGIHPMIAAWLNFRTARATQIHFSIDVLIAISSFHGTMERREEKLASSGFNTAISREVMDHLTRCFKNADWDHELYRVLTLEARSAVARCFCSRNRFTESRTMFRSILRHQEVMKVFVDMKLTDPFAAAQLGALTFLTGIADEPKETVRVGEVLLSTIVGLGENSSLCHRLCLERINQFENLGDAYEIEYGPEKRMSLWLKLLKMAEMSVSYTAFGVHETVFVFHIRHLRKGFQFAIARLGEMIDSLPQNNSRPWPLAIAYCRFHLAICKFMVADYSDAVSILTQLKIFLKGIKRSSDILTLAIWCSAYLVIGHTCLADDMGSEIEMARLVDFKPRITVPSSKINNGKFDACLAKVKTCVTMLREAGIPSKEEVSHVRSILMLHRVPALRSIWHLRDFMSSEIPLESDGRTPDYRSQIEHTIGKDAVTAANDWLNNYHRGSLAATFKEGSRRYKKIREQIDEYQNRALAQTEPSLQNDNVLDALRSAILIYMILHDGGYEGFEDVPYELHKQLVELCSSLQSDWLDYHLAQFAMLCLCMGRYEEIADLKKRFPSFSWTGWDQRAEVFESAGFPQLRRP